MDNKNKYKALEYDLKKFDSMQIGIQNMKEEYEDLKDTLTGIDVSKEFVNTYSVGDTTGNAAVLLEDLNKRIIKLENKLKRIKLALSSLSEVEYKVIVNVYFERLPYWQFTSHVGYSERQCKRIKKDALEKLYIALHGI